MRLLLDTSAFLWLILGDPRLPVEVVRSIQAPTSEVWLSAVSVWEIAVKQQLGRLPLPEPAGTYVPQQRARHQIQPLGLDETAIAHLQRLPLYHRDPFDRILICQALEHGMWLVTDDSLISRYAVRCYWGS